MNLCKWSLCGALLVMAGTTQACDPRAQCGNTEETSITLDFTADGLVANFNTAGIAGEKETLSSDEWGTWRIWGSIKTPVTNSDGEEELVNQRVFSMSAPFSTAIPASLTLGTVPDGWEQGLETYTTAGSYGDWPAGALTAGDKVTVGLEAMTDPSGNTARCTLARARNQTVPGAVSAPCVDVPSDEDNLNYPGNEQGTYTQQRNLCTGFEHVYYINVAVDCTITANLAYTGAGTDVILEIFQANGDQLLSTSPETSSPETTTAVTGGGSMAVKLRLASGDAALYTLDVIYACN